METDCGVWVHGEIVKELLASLHRLLRAFRLVACNGAQCHEEGKVDHPSIVKDASNDALDLFLLLL